MFFSASAGGFFTEAQSKPADAIRISDADHKALLVGQSSGMRITADATGRPVLVDAVPEEATADAVDRERDKRIAAGMTFQGVEFQTDPDALINIQGASTSALAAIMEGAQVGNLKWHGGETDFVWIAADNSAHAMDAQTMLEFGRAAMAHKSAHIFAGRALKSSQSIPPDFTDHSYWP